MTRASGSIAIVIPLLCSLALPARAQGVTGGIAAGVNLSEINAAGNESLNVVFTDRPNITAGGFVRAGIGRQGALEIDGLYSIKGSQLDLGAREDRIRLTYIDVPILLRYAGPAASLVRVHVLAGGYLGYLLRATRLSASGATIDVRDTFADVDIGWVAGVGLSVARVHFDARYTGGVTNLVSSSDLSALVPDADPQPRKYRNRGFTLLAAYEF
jgi:hypothetical protein